MSRRRARMRAGANGSAPDDALRETRAPTDRAAPAKGDARLRETERIQATGGPGRGWGGGMVGQKSENFGPSARRLAARMRPHGAKTAAVLALALFSVGCSVAGPKILANATNLIFAGFFGHKLPAGATKAQVIEHLRATHQDKLASMLSTMNVVPGHGIDYAALARVLATALAVYAAAAIASFLQGFVVNDVVQATMLRMRADVEAKVNSLPLRFFDRQPRGELLSRVTNDIDNISQSLQQTMSQLLTSVLTVVGVLVVMLTISPLLALVALVTVPLSLIMAAAIMKRSQRLFIAQWRTTGQLNAHIEETFTGHALVKVFGRTQADARTFEDQNEGLFRSSFGAQFASGLIMPVMMFFGNLNYVIVAVVGGLRVASGTLSLGDVQAFIQYSRQFTQPLTQLASMVNLLQSGVASAERVFELLDAEEQSADPSVPALPAGNRGEVHFEHVSFRYLEDKPLIEDLSLVVKPGQTVAIVGPTGAGKTTLVNLLMRFYELDGGRITLDGVDTATMRRADLRERIGMVLQDTWLFKGSIIDNIRYGRPDASHADVIEAATATFVDRFVHTLPDGYETVIDDEGSNVSAGQRQLITIARAFLSEPALLILDEATSSVDTRTEVLLQKAMASLRCDRTSFVIAHRLSTIRDADMILMMEDGRIVETGTHESLLAAGGAYAALYQAQFTAEPEEEALTAAGA